MYFKLTTINHQVLQLGPNAQESIEITYGPGKYEITCSLFDRDRRDGHTDVELTMDLTSITLYDKEGLLIYRRSPQRIQVWAAINCAEREDGSGENYMVKAYLKEVNGHAVSGPVIRFHYRTDTRKGTWSLKLHQP